MNRPSGTLTLLDGSQHQFKVSGLDVVAVGIKQATGMGNVYRLKQLADFEGKYVKVAAGIADRRKGDMLRISMKRRNQCT